MPSKRRFGRVRQLPSGRWQARYTGPGGDLVSAPHTFERRTDADRWLAGVETDIERGAWIDPGLGEVSVEEWGKRWLTAARPHLKVKTFAGYEALFANKIVPAFGKRPLATLRPIMVSEWVASMSGEGASPSRVRQSYRLLSQIMKSAVDNGLIPVNPCRGLRLPRMPATEPRIVSQDEVARLVREMAAPYDALVMVLAYAGLRIGEAFALRRRSVDLKAGTVIVSESLAELGGRHVFDTPKNHQRRVVALPGFVVEALCPLVEALPTGDALLFVTKRSGRPLHYAAWRETYFDPAAERAGLADLTPHALRASHATWVAEEHGIMAAAARLGHAHASVTTRHYARTIDGRDAEVDAAFDRRRPADGARKGHETLAGTESVREKGL
jgi:integrase